MVTLSWWHSMWQCPSGPKAIYLRTAVEVRYSGMHLHGDKQVSSDSPKQRAGAITCSAALILHVIWWSITVHCAVLCQETADRFPCQPRHPTSEVMWGSGLLGCDERMAEKKLVWRSWHQRSIPCFRWWTENHAEHPSNPLLKWNCWTPVGPCWTAVDCQSTRFSKTSPFSISLFWTTKCLSLVAFTQVIRFHTYSLRKSWLQQILESSYCLFRQSFTSFTSPTSSYLQAYNLPTTVNKTRYVTVTT